MKQLYKCSVEIEMLVYAESKEEAERLACRSFQEEVTAGPPEAPDFSASPWKKEDGWPGGWDGQCGPYGGDGLTVTEILDKVK